MMIMVTMVTIVTMVTMVIMVTRVTMVTMMIMVTKLKAILERTALNQRYRGPPLACTLPVGRKATTCFH